MSNVKPKTSSLVAEAFTMTYVGVFFLIILLNFVLGWDNLGMLTLIGVGGGLVVAFFGYAATVWVAAWRSSRQTRS